MAMALVLKYPRLGEREALAFALVLMCPRGGERVRGAAASALASILGAMGAARASDLTAEKQVSKVRAMREAKNGVRNAVAGSRAEIQTKLKFGL